jgi:hypothetical protein
MKANKTPENYPMQFKDKIDEYLWKEHHILGGCCSSIESLKYTVAREVAEKLTDAFIEKAVKWLSEIENGTTITDIDKFVEDFKNYMKGE